ncbi:MAG: c-type cytochrome [Acidobacteriota bacterium]|nr:c-type cytochrome [Acidobacteriota bacterium]
MQNPRQVNPVVRRDTKTGAPLAGGSTGAQETKTGAPLAGAEEAMKGATHGAAGPESKQSSSQQGGQKVAGQKLAEEQFKNIQVLKGIPADQLMPAMQFITASLGVDCEFCHDHQAMDNDDKKPKKIARKMITMMFDIDKNNFDGRLEVTCYSCHRGAAKPVSVPVIKDEDIMQAMAVAKPPANAALPKGEELLDKYLTAVGGPNAVQKITSRVEKGKLTTFDGKTFPVDVYAKAPDKRISIMHMPNGDSVTAFDGQRGWQTIPGRGAHMMSDSENDGARLDADLYFATHVKTMYPKFVVKDSEKIDGHETYLVTGENEGQPPLRLYVDKQSGQLLRLVRYGQSPLGLNPTQIDYADYRDADGVKVPFKWTLARPGNRFTIEVEDLKQNVPVDDAKFVAPPPPPPPAAGAGTEQKPPAH